MPKDFEGIRKSIDSLKELGVPENVIDDLEAWLESEKKKAEYFETGAPGTTNPSPTQIS